MKEITIGIYLKDKTNDEVIEATVQSDEVLSNGKPNYLSVLNQVTKHLNIELTKQLNKDDTSDS